MCEHEDGSQGWLLQFPRPSQRGGGMADTISNIRWFPETREIGEIFVDRETTADLPDRGALAARRRKSQA
jgi:hypothetical protein